MTPEPSQDRDPEIRHVNEKAKEIEDKLPRLKGLMDQGKVMLSMVSDYVKGNYREVPYWAISASALALLYVLNPIDIIPDVIPGVGFLDDATVVAFCLSLMEKEIDRYKAWLASKNPPPAPIKEV